MGEWKESEYPGGQYVPAAGLALACYVSALSSLADMAANPFHIALFYLRKKIPWRIRYRVEFLRTDAVGELSLLSF
ncbi:hypothetical protein PanWU01x14_370320 [Parasponia andersonii]|uniref:Uncharacterized protein n=1 Tax=Parasponia andersonii TaxID=3476 RepID=A0A2P5A4B6_PARAD|nr:hypothetical protein PanWU01x14_370320 [Parasponia andersonii]